MPTVLLADFLRRDLVLCDVVAVDLSALLTELARRVAAANEGLDAEALYRRLEQREAEGSTAVGNGLAMPHAMMPGIAQTVLAVARVAGGGVDVAAADGQTVDIVFLLVSPQGDQARHLRVLARVARILTAEDVLAQLRGADGPDTMFRMLVEEDARHVY